ncbi:MAG: DNA-3-methyladenine glycosylase [Anaerolineales bacterium]|jgi:DNA-3-methyladenine glycosylase
MGASDRLERSFFNRPTLLVARELLGKHLVRMLDGQRLSGIITETEAYIGEEDLACHCKAGRTPRTQVMYGQPGLAYVYFTYGKHWLLNFVTEAENSPAAVLIRAIIPTAGLEHIAARRGHQPPARWTDGPGKLCQALEIDGALNAYDLCQPEAVLSIENGAPIPDSSVTTGPRVGLNSVPEPWKSKPWRFLARLPDNS